MIVKLKFTNDLLASLPVNISVITIVIVVIIIIIILSFSLAVVIVKTVHLAKIRKYIRL